MRYSTKEVYDQLQASRRHQPVGTILQHKHGDTYIVTGHSFNTETMVIDIIYKRLSENLLSPLFNSIDYNRPSVQFTEDRFRGL